MQAIPLVRTTSVRPLLDFLDRLGAPAGPEIQNARALLHDTTALVPMATAGALWAAAERASEIDAFGLRVLAARGADVRAMSVGDVDHQGSVLPAGSQLRAWFDEMAPSPR